MLLLLGPGPKPQVVQVTSLSWRNINWKKLVRRDFNDECLSAVSLGVLFEEMLRLSVLFQL